ncbi:universal stress protein [Actinomadura sp. KC345]|uniref:universal stress protein n=1 Tax=Actinomadura sp. KC345 TaxID=2530371 RepID=UPI0010502A97|nr:universal stress protein [Actinomadura sp. KC345]TDC54046.1 universal stress protein [Actinomadura sp. KC345]
MPEPIVVGTDGSGESDGAVDWAAAEAVMRRRPLHIVHAVKSWPYKAPRLAPGEKAERVTRAGEAVLEATRERVHARWPDLETTTALVDMDTANALGEQSEGAFQLVMGSRGRGGFASLLLGSTSLRMAARATIPLVIVRSEAGARHDVVVGIDLPQETAAVLDYAFEAAALYGARLRVVHAWQLSPTLVDAGYTAEEEAVGEDLRDQVVAAYAPARSRHPQVEVVEEIVLKHPVSALSNASRTARLLVAGAHARRWNAPRLGSTNHGIIHHARSPVAVIPPR